MCSALIGNLIDRGLPADRALLFVIDGDKAIRRAISSHWGELALVQRCRKHSVPSGHARRERGEEIALINKLTGFPVRSVRDYLRTGRTSRKRWESYTAAADELAREGIRKADPWRPLPTTLEARLYLCLRVAGRPCKGCGKRLAGRQRTWCSKSCEMRWRRAQRPLEAGTRQP